MLILLGLLHIENKQEASFNEILDQLNRAYCGELSVELHHLQVCCCIPISKIVVAVTVVATIN